MPDVLATMQKLSNLRQLSMEDLHVLPSVRPLTLDTTGPRQLDLLHLSCTFEVTGSRVLSEFINTFSDIKHLDMEVSVSRSSPRSRHESEDPSYPHKARISSLSYTPVHVAFNQEQEEFYRLAAKALAWQGFEDLHIVMYPGTTALQRVVDLASKVKFLSVDLDNAIASKLYPFIHQTTLC